MRSCALPSRTAAAWRSAGGDFGLVEVQRFETGQPLELRQTRVGTLVAQNSRIVLGTFELLANPLGKSLVLFALPYG